MNKFVLNLSTLVITRRRYLVEHRELIAILCCVTLPILAAASSVPKANARHVSLRPVRRSVPADLATPATNSVEDIPVVTIRFLPTADGIYLDRTKAPDYYFIDPITLVDMNAKLDLTTSRIKFALTEGSRFRDYGSELARPTLGYRVVDEIVFYQVPPASTQFSDPFNPNHWPALDYYSILSSINAQHYVNDLGVKEFWVYYNTCDPSFPSWQLQPGAYNPANVRYLVESNMSSALTGDISNSVGYADDLPLYDHTYVVFEYGLVSDMSDYVHEHGHELEAMFTYAAINQDPTDRLFWNDFCGRASDPGQPFVMGTGRCGATHFPPNTNVDYDYSNPNFVNSDIEHWRPDHQGQQKPVNKDTWLNKPYQWPQIAIQPFKVPDAQWYVYWMQNMPGYNNTIPKANGQMTNWWEFVARWDQMVMAKAGLYTNPTALGGGTLSANGTQEQPFSYQLSASGSNLAYAAVALPTGLTINGATGLVSGTPLSAGTFPVLVTVTGSSTTASTILFLTIAPHTHLVGAVSRKTHAGAGTFDISLPLTGSAAVECRTGGGKCMLVFTFNNDVVSGGASVTTGTGSVSGSAVFAGSTMTVNLTGVANAQKVTVTLSGVTDSFAQVVANTVVSMNMLIGDTTGNATVNSSDVSQTKAQSGMGVSNSNFREDVTVSGDINSADVSLVKSRSGNGTNLVR